MSILWCLCKVMMWGQVLCVPLIVMGMWLMSLGTQLPMDSLGVIRGWVYLGSLLLMLLAGVVVIVHHGVYGMKRMDAIGERGRGLLFGIMFVGGGSALLWWTMVGLACVETQLLAVLIEAWLPLAMCSAAGLVGSYLVLAKYGRGK